MQPVWEKSITSCGGRRIPKVRMTTLRNTYADVGHSRYPIATGSSLLTNREPLDVTFRGRDLLIVTNTTVARLYLGKLTDSLASKRVAECILPDGANSTRRCKPPAGD